MDPEVLMKLGMLEPVRYHYIDQEDDAKKYMGFIAQDLKEVFPEVVTWNEEAEIYTVSYTELIPVLVSALQEQQEIIETQQQQINANTALLKQLQEYILREER